MECINGATLLRTLKIIDVDTSNLTSVSLDCLFDDKDTSLFMNWLCSNVNENNSHTDSDLYEFTILQNGDNVIDAENIEEIVIKTECDHPGIFNVNTNEINLLKKEIDRIRTKEDTRNNILSKYLNLDKKIAHQLTKLDEEEIDNKIKRQSILTECEEKSKYIDELHGKIFTNVKIYLDLLPMYETSDQTYFMSQMPLNNLLEECDSYYTNISMWIQKEFDSDDISSTDLDDDLETELSRMKFALEESIGKYVKTQCVEKELKSKLMYLRKNLINQISYSEEEERIKKMQINSRINTLTDELEILYSTKLQQTSKDLTEYLINAVLVSNAQINLDDCNETMQKLSFLDGEVKESLAQFLLMFTLLKNDKMIMQSINKFLEDTHFYSAMYHEQYRLKSELAINKEEISTDDSFFIDILTLLTDRFSARKISLQEIQKVINRRKVKIQNLENSLFVLENQKYWDTINIARKDLQKVKLFLYCGPTLQPIIIPYEWLESLENTNASLANVDKKIRSTLDKYKQVMNMLDKNRWLKFKRLLWAWYLIKPEMVIKIVNQIRNFVVEQVKNDA